MVVFFAHPSETSGGHRLHRSIQSPGSGPGTASHLLGFSLVERLRHGYNRICSGRGVGRVCEPAVPFKHSVRDREVVRACTPKGCQNPPAEEQMIHSILRCALDNVSRVFLFKLMMESLALNERSRYNRICSGRGSVRLEHSVRDREVGGSNPPAPTKRP